MRPTLLHGGAVRTMDGAIPLAGEILIEGERIVSHEGREPDRIDLRGRCVVPGFTDSHTHFPTWSLARKQVRLEGAKTLQEALARVEAFAPQVPSGTWLRGHGWRSGDWHPHTEPTKHDLDRVAPDVPVALMSRDYHSLWLNSKALALAGGDLAVHGGVVELDGNGEPTGVLREESAWRFRDRYAAPTEQELLDATREALPVAAARGVTSIHDKDGWLDALSIFHRIHLDGALTLRVWQSLPFDRLDAIERLKLHSRLGDDFLRAGYIKCFMDGTLGSDTALRVDGSGVEILSQDAFEEIVVRAARSGFPVGVHAIGDLANQRALDGFEATREHWEPLGLRQRIEHTQLLRPEDFPRFAQLGITCSVQFSHAPSDRDLAEEHWPDATGRAYAYRSLLDAGARLVNGSDAPVEELDPLAGICAGVLRTIDSRDAWHPEQRVTVEEALRAATVEPAWLARDENRRGRLVPGLLADLVVLDRDPLAIPPEELPEVRVVATMVGGRWVHGEDELREG